MARFLTCGFEINSTTAGHEARTLSYTGSGITISSTVKRTGGFALRVALSGVGVRSASWENPTAMANTGDVFQRFYLWIDTLPDAACEIFNAGGYLRLNADGTVDVYDQAPNLKQAGITTFATGEWIRGEVRYNTTNSAFQVRVNGTDVYTAASGFNLGTPSLALGGNIASTGATSGIWYFDDVAQNDASGASQNTWCGAGSICYLRPNGAGDADTGSPTRGGADSGTIEGQLDENPPNDATDYVVLPANPSDFWVDVEDGSVGGIGASDTITLVEVHGRVSAASGTASSWFPQIKKVSGGTVFSATSVNWASAVWFTNDDTAAARECKLVRYVDPDSAAWTPTTIDSMQLSGATVDGNPDTWVSAMWAVVEFVPTEAPPPGTRFLLH